MAAAPRKPANSAIENRPGLLAAYYKVPAKVIGELAKKSYKERLPLCKQQHIDPSIFHTMVDYTRYPQAERIHQQLAGMRVPLRGLSVVDFGCHVADYGLYFARLGAKVTLYDVERKVKFAQFRFAREKLPAESFLVPTDYAQLFAGRDLAVFGEVLEHLDDPLAVLQACVDNSVKYIFTSHYPFGDDAYFALGSHSKLAQAQQADCVELLRAHYLGLALADKEFLWRHKSPRPGT